MASTRTPSPKRPQRFVVARGAQAPTWRLPALLVLLLAITAGLAAWVTTKVVVPQHAAIKAELDSLRATLANAATAEAAATRRVARLEQDMEVANSARTELLETLTQKQAELAQAREDLSFYQRLVGQGGQRKGLSVHSLQLVPTASQRVYRLEVTLSQNLRRAGVISGNVGLVIEGIEQDQPRRLRSADLLEDSNTGLSFRFKYFQLLDGSIVLPEGFIPERIIVTIVPDELEKGADGPAPQTFAWQDALEGVSNV